MKVILTFIGDKVRIANENGNYAILENEAAMASSEHTIEILFPGTTTLIEQRKETSHLCCKCNNIETFYCEGHYHTAYVCSYCAVDLAF